MNSQVRSIVPAEFDLEKALSARSTTPMEERARCRECKSVRIRRKPNSPRGGMRVHPEKYVCRDCNSHFDRPIRGAQ